MQTQQLEIDSTEFPFGENTERAEQRKLSQDLNKLCDRVYRRDHSTTVDSPCGHRVDKQSVPSHGNCEDCWFSYFTANPRFVYAVFGVYENSTVEDADKYLKHVHGSKFLKYFKRFIAHVQEIGARNLEVESD